VPAVPRPDFIRNKPRMPDQLLKDKRAGRYVTGIPAIGWDAEEGFNLGGFAEWYDNGSKSDPFFRTAPYRMKIFAGGTVSSEGATRLLGRLDWVYIHDSPFRFRVDALFEKNPIKNYFGQGRDGIPLVSPRTGRRFGSFDSYQKDLNGTFAGPAGACGAGERCTWSRYNKYDARDFVSVASLEYDLLGGLVRPLIGLQVRHISVDDYSGDRVDRIDGSGRARQASTRLRQDCQARIVRDCDGGWDNYLKLGLTYDSRDFEPNPTRGAWLQMSFAASSKLLGSDLAYQRLTFSGAWYHDFFRGRDDVQQLILAARAVYNMSFNDPPFYALPRAGFNDFDRAGLGGFLTLRGYKSQRFVGTSALLMNAELRWFFTQWTLWGQHLKPGVAIFGDVGRANRNVRLDFGDLQGAGGVGFRLAWNLATLVSFDLGVSGEDTIFYMELGTTF